MRPAAVLLALALLPGCGAPESRSAAGPTPDSAAVWRWAGAPVTLLGRPTGVVFEREGAVEPNAPAKSMHITARCIGCASAAPLEFDVATPAVKYELDPGIAESINATVVFPAEGTWTFEPLRGQLVVRSPTSAQAPLVVVRPWSIPLNADCGPKQIADVFANFANAFNTGSPADLAQSLNHAVDFSISGEPLPPFVTRKREDVADYVLARHAAGETIHPYLVYAATRGDNAVDLAVYFVRTAPDLPSASGRSYRYATAGSRLFCYDLLLLRFNADLFKE
jgi:hypothetical protein